MSFIRIVKDMEECRALWEQAVPRERISDLWEVRACFQEYFNREPYFIVMENHDGIKGLVPLSRIEECGCYAYFPGETWQGKTWLEQNRIPDLRQFSLDWLLQQIDMPCHLRYISPFPSKSCSRALDRTLQKQDEMEVDEIGYLFHPPMYNYDMEIYYREFSGKSLKQIRREISAIQEKGVVFRYDEFSDFDLMVEMNISRFGSSSYFYDSRFMKSFHSLARLLNERGWLRFTSVLINGEPAAVDMACIYKNVLTVLAGGTNSRYPGVAKLINLHHMERSCKEHIREVDFLCGDFTWKKMFHLSPRPLYLLSNLTRTVSRVC